MSGKDLKKQLMYNHIYLRMNSKCDEINLICDFQSLKYAWIENVNKHLPDIFALRITDKNIVIDRNVIESLVNKFQRGTVFKLSLSSKENRIPYRIVSDWSELLFCRKIKFIKTCENELEIVLLDGLEKKDETCSNDGFIKLPKLSEMSFKYVSLPVNVAVIGTCFSRSVFKSEPYFNPDYKRYFNVCYTAFHNSFISLMSEPITHLEYASIKDLQTEEASRYIEVEFCKDIMTRLQKNRPDIVLIDNYMEATAPVVKIENNKYLTYNKYFSESIFKYNFSPCDILWPGSMEHQALLRNALLKFRSQLKQAGLEKCIILLSCRLCSKKFDGKTKKTELWTDKMDWIRNSNINWNIADSIFAYEFPESRHIDMRNTKWMSDIYSPIIGGASPSHYQSGYYKEIFDKLKKLL